MDLNGIFVCFIFSITIAIQCIYCQESISIIPNRLLTFSMNSPTNAIPIRLELVNGSTPLDIVGQVQVACSLKYEASLLGYTYGTFSSNIHGAPSARVSSPVEVQITFQLLRPGRPNQVTCEANTLGNVSSPQFNGTTSDPNDPLIASLEIVCDITSPANTTKLRFMPMTVSALGRIQATVEYEIVEKVYTPFTVHCTGRSINSTQYLLTSSATDPAVYRLEEGSATISPNGGTIYTTSYQAILSLNKPVTSAMAFKCNVAASESLSLAQHYQTGCMKVESYGTRPPSTTTPMMTQFVTHPTSTTTAGHIASIDTASTPDSTTTAIPTGSGSGTTTTADTSTTTAAPTTTTVNATTSTSAATTAPPTTTTAAITTTTPAITTTTATSNTTGNGTTTTAPTASPTYDVSSWKLSEENNTLILGSNTQQLKFTVIRTVPTSSTEEYVTVSCCAEADRFTQIFTGVEATSIVKFEYTYSGQESGAETLSGVTPILNPAYIELAPCPCDLTSRLCDVTCACDSDCSEAEKSLFNANINGVFGGENRSLADHFCSRNGRVGAPDWVPLLCTHRENNAHLGNFYFAKSIITADGNFPAGSDNSYRMSITEAVLPSSLHFGYKKGTFIERETDGYLAMPQSTSSGTCIDTSLITYLDDIDTACTMTMESALCESTSSRLNAANYLQRTTQISNFSPLQTITRIRRQHGSDAPASVESRFYCTNQLSGYVALSANEKTQSSDYLTQDNIQTQDPASMSFCSWDDDHTFPPSPILVNGICHNAIIDVDYKIEYNSTAISRVVATYKMANISMETVDVGLLTRPPRPTILTTRYKATFKPPGAANSIRYSGKPGYNMDSPLNLALANLTSRNLTAYPQPTIPVSGVDGLCEFTSKELLKFPFNQMSQCQLEISAADLENCSMLRNSVYKKLELLFPVSKPDLHMSRFGTPKYTQFTNWVQMFRDINQYDLVPTATPAPTDGSNVTTPAPNTTAGIPPTASITSVTTDMPLSGVVIITPAPQVPVKDVCGRVPTSAKLQVIYALSGRSAGTPIYQVIGANVKVMESTWRFSCLYSNCQNSSDRFTLTFSTEFIEAPALPPPQTIRYYKKKEAECEQCLPQWTVESLLYPVRGRHIPQELRAENLAMFLFLVGCLFALWCCSRPRWHKHHS